VSALEGLDFAVWLLFVMAAALCFGLVAGLVIGMLDRRRRDLPLHRGPALLGILLMLGAVLGLAAVWIRSGS
jgi:hypothetical protein